MQTITVNNFDGYLTRDVFGDINSGASPMTYFTYGIDPFYNRYPSSLVSMPAATSIGTTTLVDPIMKFVRRMDALGGGSLDPYVYGVGLNGKVYQVRVADTGNLLPDKDAITKFTNDISGTSTLKYGGGMIVSKVTSTSNLYIGCDTGMFQSSDFTTPNPATQTWTSITGLTVTNVPRPLVEFLGKIYTSNGNNLAQYSTGTSFTSVGVWGTSLPKDFVIKDMDISHDGRYLVTVALGSVNNNTIFDLSAGKTYYNQPMDSAVVLWNGSDTNYTQLKMLKGVIITAIAVSNTETLLIGKDDLGISLYDTEGNRLDSIMDTASSTMVIPPDSVHVVGKKIFFLAQLGVSTYLFCFDREKGKSYALWMNDIGSETVKGACIIPSFHSSDYSGLDTSRLKIYFSYGALPISTQANNILNSMHLQAYASETFQTAQYGTQVVKFPSKIDVKEVRFFVYPTSSGESLSASFSDGNGLIVNSSMSYTFSAGSDKTLAQGSLEILKFKPQIYHTQNLGLRIRVTGGLIINKVEIDYDIVPNPQ